MKTMHATHTNIIISSVISLLAFFLFFAFATSVSAATCEFTRDLEFGDMGEDVRCLQQYLNSAGYTIAETGVGSPGHETTEYKTLTETAVIAWQKANNLSPAIGYFGPLSREKYDELTSGTQTTEGTDTPGGENAEHIAGLLKQLETLKAQVAAGNANNSGSSSDNVTESDARKAIRAALDELELAESQYENATDDNEETGDADEELADARDDFYEAVAAYLDKNYQRALPFAESARDTAIDAFEEAGGVTESEELEDRLDELDDEIDDAWVTIENAQEDDKDVDEAEELLEEAEDKLDEAEEALKEDDLDEAEELADEVEDLIEDALDAIGDSEKEQAADAIDDAEDAIDDAWDEVEEAEDDGEDVDEAEELLEEAEEALEDAEDAYDDGDYDDAIDYADEAEELAEEALDEI